MPNTNRLSRHVLQEFVAPTLLGLLVYGFVLLMNAFLLVARLALAKNLGFDTVLRLFSLEIPQLLVLAIPMATILGVLIAFGRLSADHEIVAIHGAGLGPWFLLRPVLLLGLFTSLVSFSIYAVVVPRASYASRVLNSKVLLSGSMATNLDPRVFYSEIPGYVLFAEGIRPGAAGRLDGVFVHEAKGEGGQSYTFFAREGDLYQTQDGSGKLIADLRKGVGLIYTDDHPEVYRSIEFERYQVPIDPPPYLKALSTPPTPSIQNIAFTELFGELREARAMKEKALRDYRTRATRVEIHQRLALPFAAFVFALLGMPLGMTRARSGKGASFALSIAVTLVYWIAFTSARDQALQGRFPVFLGVWSGNIITAAWAAWAFYRMGRRASDQGVLGRLKSAVESVLARIRARGDRARDAGSPGAPTSSPSPPHEWAGATSTYRLIGLVDGLILSNYLRVLVYALLSAYAVFAVVDLKEILDSVLRNERSFWMVMNYFKYFAPGKLNLILPVACLVAGVVAFTLLGRSGELTAMKASGVSMRRAMAPVILATIALCAVLFVVQDRIAPVTNQRAQEARDRIQGKPPRTYGLSVGGRWTFGPGGRYLYHYRLYDPDHQTFQGLSVFTLDRSAPRVTEHRFAAVAKWNGNAWLLERGWYRNFPADKSVGTFRTFDNGERCALDPPENFARREITLMTGGDLPDQMNIVDLRKQIETLQDSGYDITRLKVAFYAKLAHPVTPLVMVLLGLPFAFQVGRRGSLYGIGVALVLVIVYWATFAVFNALGFETVLPPFLAAWAPNILYGLLGAYLLLYVKT
jgi:LPS export ABC transporter permease LptG/LPS export ABC transporter permease LptF